MRKLLIFHFVISIGLLMSFSACLASEIQPKGSKNDGTLIGITGEIESSDASKLEASLEAARRAGVTVSTITLDSPGGKIVGGAGLAKVVRAAQLRTVVPDGATCASACFMIFAAGKERYAGMSARIGVHSARTPKIGEDEGAKSATIDMVRFLSELGVPPQVLGKLVTSRPDEMAWLTQEDLRSMRTNMVVPPKKDESYVERVAPAIEKPPSIASPEDLKKARTLMTLGLSHIRAGQPSQAVAILKQATRYSPYDPDIASTYGYALHLSGNNNEAKDALTLALQIKKDFSETYRVLALVSAALNDKDWAKASLINYYNFSNYKNIAGESILDFVKIVSTNKVLKLAALEASQTLGLK